MRVDMRCTAVTSLAQAGGVSSTPVADDGRRGAVRQRKGVQRVDTYLNDYARVAGQELMRRFILVVRHIAQTDIRRAAQWSGLSEQIIQSIQRMSDTEIDKLTGLLGECAFAPRVSPALLSHAIAEARRDTPKPATCAAIRLLGVAQMSTARAKEVDRSVTQPSVL